MTLPSARSPFPEDQPDRQKLINAHDAAAMFYREHLEMPNGQPPCRYLTSRGLQHIIGSERWTVGYAPNSWTALTDHLRSDGFTNLELEAAGLSLRTRRGTLIDRFRERITIGIHNTDGDLIAFTARAAPHAGASTPKYLNSPSTALFTKGEVLFGLAEQRERSMAQATPVLVEGPLDVFAIESAATRGFVAVAPCGTSLTAEQVTALAAHSGERVIVCYDDDVAGTRAAAIAYPILRAAFLTVDTVDLPDGNDPASTLALNDGPRLLNEALSQTRPLADLVVDERIKPFRANLDNAEARVCALKSVASAVTLLGSSDVARQATRLSQILDFPAETVTQEFTAAASKTTHPKLTAITRPSARVTAAASELECQSRIRDPQAPVASLPRIGRRCR